jgi:hypothetical protein
MERTLFYLTLRLNFTLSLDEQRPSLAGEAMVSLAVGSFPNPLRPGAGSVCIVIIRRL